jgi:oligogalacturonide lyase
MELFRVTDPAHASVLAPPQNRTVARRGGFLIFASDRTGTWQLFSVDLKSWRIHQITTVESLNVSSFSLTPDDRYVVLIAADSLGRVPVGGGRLQPLHRLSSSSNGGMAVIPDGPSVLLAEGATRLLRIPMGKGVPTPVVENKEGVLDPLPRPRRAAIAYRSRDNALWLAHLDGSRNTRLRLGARPAGPAQWSADGRSLFYLTSPEESRKPVELREFNPDAGEDKLVAATSQYIRFSANSDASVFVAASSSKAGPYVLLMVRSVRRELALCEHKSSDPAAASPFFSPNSQQIFFQSDRHGKPAIYAMPVAWLVEKTESEDVTTELK